MWNISEKKEVISVYKHKITEHQPIPFKEALNKYMKMNLVNLTSVLTGLLLATVLAEKAVSKRGFADLGCMGVYDKSKFARLDRVCEECYQLFRQADIHISCRSNCFKNDVFNKCVDALLLRKDQLSLDYMVDQLYGRK